MSRDPRINRYVGCVTRALVDALPQPHGEWSVAVFEDSSPNAFALPGCKIGVNSGMLKVARTPDQLAAAGGARPLEFLSTHPSHDSRTDDLIEGMEEALGLYKQARAAGRRPNCRPPGRTR